MAWSNQWVWVAIWPGSGPVVLIWPSAGSFSWPPTRDLHTYRHRVDEWAQTVSAAPRTIDEEASTTCANGLSATASRHGVLVLIARVRSVQPGSSQCSVAGPQTELDRGGTPESVAVRTEL